MLNVRDITGILRNAYPFSRAESWDKVGLLIGDANMEINYLLVAHEVTDATIDEAQNVGANCLVVYHPPLFRPLENLNFSNHSVRLAARCISANIAVVAVHTALDNAPLGRALGDKLAAQLGIRDVDVFKPSGQEGLYKLIVYVPINDVERLQWAMWDAGAGAIGSYDQASFRVRGQGTFRPLEGANPTIGHIGKLETVDEWRLEVIVPESKREAVLQAMKEAHPYEEVAHDIYKFRINGGESWGAARIGHLKSSTRFVDFARHVQEKLSAPNLRLIPSKKNEIRIVACVPGSGASYIDAAAKIGCDCLITGDIKHHDALQAQVHNMSIIDATHTATERAAIEMIAEVFEQYDTCVPIVRSQIDTNPFHALD